MNSDPHQPSSPDTPPLTLGDVLEIIRRHRVKAAVTCVLTMVVVLAMMLGRTPLYEAQATVALDRGRRPVDFDPRAQFDPYTGNFEHDLLNTQRTILQSRTVLEAALKSGGLLLNEHYVAVADAVDRLRDRLIISISRDSWDLAIALRDEDPRRAEIALQAMLEAYFAQQVARERQRAESSLTFLDDQLAEARRKVEQAREEQQNFQREKDLFVIDPEKSLPAQKLTSLNSKKVVLAQQTSALSTLVEQISAIDSISDPAKRLDAYLGLELVNRHPVVIEQQKQLFELKTEEAKRSEKYLDLHPRMLEIRASIAIKLKHLTESVAAVRNGVLSDYEKMNAQVPGLMQAIKLAENELNGYRENLFSLNTLTQQTKASEELYSQLLKRQGEERVTRRIDVQQMSVIDPPRARNQAVNINLPFAVLLASLLGACAGIALPLLFAFFGRRADGAEGIRDLIGAPVLGELPNIPALPMLGAEGDPTHPEKLAEAFRSLRTALRFKGRGDGTGQCLVITSCNEGEGKSTTCARLAVSMATSGLRVLLVDADLRRPTQRNQLGQECERGLSELLQGEPGISPAATTYANLDLLDAGKPSGNPNELLHSHCLPEWLELCRAQYDYVLIDSPPLDPFSDALVVGEYADGLLLVVRDGKTLKRGLMRARARLAPLVDKLLGVVVVARVEAIASLGYYGQRRQSVPNETRAGA